MVFNKKLTYYKVTNAVEKHHRLQYKDGLNEILPTEVFSESGSCVSGGIYFTTGPCLKDFLNLGVFIREVTVPEDARVIVDMNKFRADKVILGKRTPLTDVDYYTSIGGVVGQQYIIALARVGATAVIKDCFDNRDAARFGMPAEAVKAAAHAGFPDTMELTASLLGFFPEAALNEIVRDAREYLLDIAIKLGAVITDDTVTTAACAGNTELMKKCVSLGASASHKALLAAVGHGFLFTALEVISMGIPVSDAAMELAAARGHTHILRELHLLGGTITERAVTVAAQEGYLDTLREAVKLGGNVTEGTIISAAEKGNTDTMKAAFVYGARVTELAIFKAAAAGQAKSMVEAIRLLRCRETDSYTKQKFRVGKTTADAMITAATIRGYTDVMEAVHTHFGGTINEKVTNLAAQYGHVQTLQRAVDLGAKVRDDAVTLAARWGYENAIEKAIELGAHVTKEALVSSVMGTSTGCVECLVRYGAVIDEEVMLQAAEHGFPSITRMLLKLGGEATAVVIDKAKQLRHCEVAKVLTRWMEEHKTEDRD